MKYTRAETGQRIFTPENPVEWRGMATGMNEAAEELGIPVSQRAKYDFPDWMMVSAYIPGSDRSDRAITPSQISEKLLEHNIRRTRYKISQIIRHMTNLDKAVHPHRRNIGKGCFAFVKEMGGVKTKALEPKDTGLLYIVNAYYFGKTHDEVLEVRRRWGLIIRG